MEGVGIVSCLMRGGLSLMTFREWSCMTEVDSL